MIGWLINLSQKNMADWSCHSTSRLNPNKQCTVIMLQWPMNNSQLLNINSDSVILIFSLVIIIIINNVSMNSLPAHSWDDQIHQRQSVTSHHPVWSHCSHNIQTSSVPVDAVCTQHRASLNCRADAAGCHWLPGKHKPRQTARGTAGTWWSCTVRLHR